MPHNDWRPDRGMTEPGVQVRKVVDLSQAQCDKIAELSAPLGPTKRLMVQQTVTKTGGTHLYVRVGDDEWHIGRDGNAIKMGLYLPTANPGDPFIENGSSEAEDQRTADQRRRDLEAEELRIARRVIDRVGPPPPGEGTHPLQRHRDSMG